MALLKPDTDNGAGPLVSLGEFNSILVRRTVSLSSTAGTAVFGTGSNQTATISGLVYGEMVGIALGNLPDADSGNRVMINKSGTVMGDPSGISVAIQMIGQKSEVTNNGHIYGFVGISVGSEDGPTSQIINNGDIVTGFVGIIQGVGSTDTLRIFNTGTISAPIAIRGNNADAREVVINKGSIYGNIDFSLGNDLYDGRGGRVFGTILGGDGTDRFIPGGWGETIDGGLNGNDMIDFRAGPGIRVDLDESFANTLNAKGDVYTDIEKVEGSAKGADVLRGDNDFNQLHGNGGNDTLIARGGAFDQLTGGMGRDRMTGGAGTDIFAFNKPAEGGDTITDFNGGIAGIDVFGFQVSGFQAGLVVGVLAEARFHAGGSNQAHDGSDRFIFRTTDKTLWFDRDGTGNADPVLIADLQQNATIVAANISIF